MCMHLCRKKIFNLTQHFLHLNLSIALLLGLITFVSGIETASKYRVSYNIMLLILARRLDFELFRQAVLLWLYCFTISLWQHFAGCSVKDYYFLFCCTWCSIEDFLEGRGSSLYLVGVRKVFAYN